MAYVKLPADTKHPFWKKIRRYQELSGDWSGGVPIRAIREAAEATGGTLPYLSSDTLESGLGWKGKKGRCESAMLQAMLIEKVEDGYRVVDWPELGGHIAKFKIRGSKGGVALWHGKKALTVEATSNATSTA